MNSQNQESPLIEQKIKNLFGEKSAPEALNVPVSTSSPEGPAIQPASPVVDPGPAPGPQPVVVSKTRKQWIFPKPYRKTVNKLHREAVESGSLDPDATKHIPYGVSNGCQCSRCKVAREEFTETVDFEERSETGSGDLDPEFFELFDEEMIADIGDTPNQFVAMYLENKLHAAQKVVDVWAKSSEKELRILGKQGKKLIQMYLRLPDTKHLSLILFLIWWVFTQGIKVRKTIILVRAEGQKNV